MSDVNVIQRTQHIIVNPYSSSVAVISTGPTGPAGPPGPAHPSGIAEVTGLSVRGTVSTPILQGGLGYAIMLDPGGGVLEQRGTDVTLVDTGPTTTSQMQIMTEGLYHINGYVRIDGNGCTAGSLLGVLRNGMAIARHTFVPCGYTSVQIAKEAYLLSGDRIALFGYSTGGTWVASVVPQSQIDPYSPHLAIWRVKAGPKGDPG